MGDGDKQFGPLPGGLPLQIYRAVFGDNLGDFRSRHGHGIPGVQAGHDARVRPAIFVGIGEMQADKSMAAGGSVSAAGEFQLAAGPADLAEPDRFRADLAFFRSTFNAPLMAICFFSCARLSPPGYWYSPPEIRPCPDYD